MKLLLTGSSGFIGNYFHDKYGSKYNIKSFSFLKDDLDNLDLTQVNTIVHLSALVHQMGGASKEEYWKVNVDNTLAMAQKAKNNGVKHFIFMSSVKVYGEERDSPYTEETSCYPIDEYGKSKLEAEKRLIEMKDDDFKISIIRTPIVYGYGVKANIKNLTNLVNKVSILPFSDIKNRRSMVYIGNLCHLIDIIIQKKDSGVFLASDDESLSTTRLIELIAKEFDKKVYLVKIPFFRDLLKIIKPDFHKRLYESLEVTNSQTKEILNLKNPFSTEQGIKYMILGEK